MGYNIKGQQTSSTQVPSGTGRREGHNVSLLRVPSRDPVSTTPRGPVFPGMKEGQRDRITVATAVTCSLAGSAEQAAPPHSYRVSRRGAGD
ncbi:hypothetical protein AMECASPLE_006507 [Ameca splendens]|uniref:Uncharacterized protein n=1 Tax=Ameca splendens TaxID=208324 RepID=A0ABV1A6S3_9TELE